MSDEFLFGKANTYGTTTFYDFLKPENKGKEVYICNGSACMCAGTQEELKNQIVENIDADKIGHMTCLGRCHENGAFNYNGRNYSNLSKEEIKELFKTPFIQKDRYKVGVSGNPVLTEKTGDIQSYYEILKSAFK